MGNTKLTLNNIFIFLFLIVFPLGQIIRIGIIQPVDLVAGLAALYAVFARLERPKIFKYLNHFLMIAVFSWIVGAAIFRQIDVVYGLLYLVRLAVYFYFLIYVWNFTKKNIGNTKLILNSLVTVSVASAVFGWIQYFMFPSIKPFAVWGWDDHLFRLVGTFLDPTFLGIVIVFGFLISIYQFIQNKNKLSLLISVFLLISLAFTYSRASYLAFLAGIIITGFAWKKFRQIIYLIMGLVLLIAILPTSGNHILAITRSFSIVDRVENYTQVFSIFKKSPVFGIGYDNLCLAKTKLLNFNELESHSCSGSDSSLLFILSTMGVTGMIVFIYMVWNIGASIYKNKYFLVICSTFLALLVHSSFSNSLVYSWVLGWMMILLTVALKD